MARFPVVGGDQGTWGDIITQWADVSHNDDDTLKPGALSEAGALLAGNNLSDLTDPAAAAAALGISPTGLVMPWLVAVGHRIYEGVGGKRWRTTGYDSFHMTPYNNTGKGGPMSPRQIDDFMAGCRPGSLFRIFCFAPNPTPFVANYYSVANGYSGAGPTWDQYLSNIDIIVNTAEKFGHRVILSLLEWNNALSEAFFGCQGASGSWAAGSYSAATSKSHAWVSGAGAYQSPAPTSTGSVSAITLNPQWKSSTFIPYMASLGITTTGLQPGQAGYTGTTTGSPEDWIRSVVTRYATNPVVAIYDICNEPVDNCPTYGGVINQPTVAGNVLTFPYPNSLNWSSGIHVGSIIQGPGIDGYGVVSAMGGVTNAWTITVTGATAYFGTTHPLQGTVGTLVNGGAYSFCSLNDWITFVTTVKGWIKEINPNALVYISCGGQNFTNGFGATLPIALEGIGPKNGAMFFGQLDLLSIHDYSEYGWVRGYQAWMGLQLGKPVLLDEHGVNGGLGWGKVSDPTPNLQYNWPASSATPGVDPTAQHDLLEAQMNDAFAFDSVAAACTWESRGSLTETLGGVQFTKGSTVINFTGDTVPYANIGDTVSSPLFLTPGTAVSGPSGNLFGNNTLTLSKPAIATGIGLIEFNGAPSGNWNGVTYDPLQGGITTKMVREFDVYASRFNATVIDGLDGWFDANFSRQFQPGVPIGGAPAATVTGVTKLGGSILRFAAVNTYIVGDVICFPGNTNILNAAAVVSDHSAGTSGFWMDNILNNTYTYGGKTFVVTAATGTTFTIDAGIVPADNWVKGGVAMSDTNNKFVPDHWRQPPAYVLTALTCTAGVYTATFATNHPFAVGQEARPTKVTSTSGVMAGILNDNFFVVASVPAANQITFSATDAGGDTWTSNGAVYTYPLTAPHSAVLYRQATAAAGPRAAYGDMGQGVASVKFDGSATGTTSTGASTYGTFIPTETFIPVGSTANQGWPIGAGQAQFGHQHHFFMRLMPTAYPAAVSYLISPADATGAGVTNGLAISMDSTGHIRVDIYGGATLATSSTALSLGVPHSVEVSIDAYGNGTNGTITIVIDGLPDTTVTTTSFTPAFAFAHLGGDNTSAHGYTGHLAQVLHYTSILGQADRARVMNHFAEIS